MADKDRPRRPLDTQRRRGSRHYEDSPESPTRTLRRRRIEGQTQQTEHAGSSERHNLTTDLPHGSPAFAGAIRHESPTHDRFVPRCEHQQKDSSPVSRHANRGPPHRAGRVHHHRPWHSHARHRGDQDHGLSPTLQDIPVGHQQKSPRGGRRSSFGRQVQQHTGDQDQVALHYNRGRHRRRPSHTLHQGAQRTDLLHEDREQHKAPSHTKHTGGGQHKAPSHTKHTGGGQHKAPSHTKHTGGEQHKAPSHTKHTGGEQKRRTSQTEHHTDGEQKRRTSQTEHHTDGEQKRRTSQTEHHTDGEQKRRTSQTEHHTGGEQKRRTSQTEHHTDGEQKRRTSQTEHHTDGEQKRRTSQTEHHTDGEQKPSPLTRHHASEEKKKGTPHTKQQAGEKQKGTPNTTYPASGNKQRGRSHSKHQPSAEKQEESPHTPNQREGSPQAEQHVSGNQEWKRLQDETLKIWTARCHKYFPELHKKAYFLPAVYFNKVPYDVKTHVQQTIFIPLKPTTVGVKKSRTASGPSNAPDQTDAAFSSDQTPQHPRGMWSSHGGPVEVKEVFESDVREDRAQQHLLHCIQALAERQKEVMIVISQLNFRKYLDQKDSPVNAAAAALLPKPVTLKREDQRGDFDVLIVHSKHGLVVAEVKSVCAGNALQKRVERAIKQLNKAEGVLKHMVSDLEHVNVIKTLVLPNVTSAELAAGLNDSVKEELRKCLGGSDVDTALRRCLCADHLSPHATPWHVSDAVFQSLSDWWQSTITMNNPETNMPTELYEQLVARFCGSATTVDVVTATSLRKRINCTGEAVAEAGKRMTQLMLYEDQINLLNRCPARVFLTGPPGTGKSIVLAFRCLQWLNEGKDVHVVNTWKLGRAAFFLLVHQVEETLKARKTGNKPKSRVFSHMYDFQNNDGDMEKAIKDLETAASKDVGRLYVVIDEAGPEHGLCEYDKFQTFCDDLVTKVPQVCIWAASCLHKLRPDCLPEKQLTNSLRCPPAVTRQITDSSLIKEEYVYGYTVDPELPPPTDGPKVHWPRHDRGVAHEGKPEDCHQCGVGIANILDKDLNLNPNGEEGALQYRDVLILCNNARDEEKDSNGKVITPASGIIQGLRSHDVPVQVVRASDPNYIIKRVALAEENKVTVAELGAVMGLERSVVFGMGTPLYNRLYNRLYAMSRCTAQLAWIDRPSAAGFL